jgi:purine-cytosine permease-like protein
VPFFVLPGIYVGPIAQRLGQVDIAWLVGLVVAGGAYLILSRSLDLQREKAAADRSEAELAELG